MCIASFKALDYFSEPCLTSGVRWLALQQNSITFQVTSIVFVAHQNKDATVATVLRNAAQQKDMSSMSFETCNEIQLHIYL